MKIGDTATLHAPVHEVWAALTDPVVLAAAIPGCQRLEPASPGTWRFTLAADVASMHGTFTGDATVTERRPREYVTVTARGAGGLGGVTATVRVTLAPGADDTTELSYDADTTIDGQLAGIGRRMLASAGMRLASQFLTALSQVLTRNGADSLNPAPTARPAPAQSPANAPTLSFLPGVLAGGAAGAVAGFVAAWLIARRGR